MFNKRKTEELKEENNEFKNDVVYALYFYTYKGEPAQLRASKNIEKLKKNKEKHERERDSIYKIKPIKELRKEQEMFNNLKEEMETKGVSKEEISCVLWIFAKYNFIFEKTTDI